MVAYVVEALDDVALVCDEPLKSMDRMSPFVWRDQHDLTLLRMMMRGVPRPLGPDDPTGTIWAGKSTDGLTFEMEPRPAIVPGPDPVDSGGVEDPTVWAGGDELMVYYTGVHSDRQQGSLLIASGPDYHSLKKQAVMLQAPRDEGNIKEATLARAADGSWRLFYEFARDDASRVGLATAPTLGQPWTPVSEPFTIREDSWDNWHLSTGPMIQLPGRDPVMFYNGATRDARWRIGWVSFDENYTRVTERCIEPLLVPPPELDRTATDIAFAASALLENDCTIHLYYSLEDMRLARATVCAFDYAPVRR